MGSISEKGRIFTRDGDVLPASALEELKTLLACEIVLRGEVSQERYRDAIDRFNKAAIKEAAIIVFCGSDNDVAVTLGYVQKWNLDFTIACGRHSYYGASSTEGLVVDLGKMHQVSIDEQVMTIIAQGGCRAKHLEAPLQERGLSVVMGAANDTGIGGITLGGGSGALTGQYGLVIDNLLAAKVVIADGSVLECSESKNPDLFWAIRGGGSNFGVVTEFTYRIYKQGDVYFGPLIFTPDKTRELLELAADIEKIVDGSNGKLAVYMGWLRGPGQPKIAPIAIVFYDGPEEEAKYLLAPVWAVGPVAVKARMMKYADITEATQMTKGPAGLQHYSMSSALMHSPLDISLVEHIVDGMNRLFEKYGDAIAPSKLLVEIRSYAKSGSVPPSATALAARRPAYLVFLDIQHSPDASSSEIYAEAKAIMDKVREEVRKDGLSKGGGSFANANIGAGSEKVADMFGENLPRLREIKRKYDPGFIFNKWYPISPAEV